MAKLCLLFLRAVSETQTAPAEIESLVKERVQHQVEAQVPDLQVNFDEGSCAQVGTYSFGLDQLVLTARTDAWNGRLEAPLGTLLDARPIDLTSVLGKNFGEAAVAQSAWRRPSEERAWRKPVGWGVVGALGGAAAGFALSPNHPSRLPNALVFGLIGAASAALLSFAF